MQLAEGKLYRTRDGKTAGSIVPTRHALYPWRGVVEGEPHSEISMWTDTGRYFAHENPHRLDLTSSIESSAEKPIDKVTLLDYRRGVARVFDSYRLRY